MRPVEKVLQRVEGVQERANGFWALCPAHDDHNPSLHVTETEDATVLLKCFAGCSQAAVLEGLKERGIEKRDLFADNAGGAVVPIGGRPKVPKGRRKDLGRLAKTYEIRDASGRLVAFHERWENGKDKSFFWKHPNGKYSRKGEIVASAMPLYGAELVADWPDGCGIVLVEGETPAEALRAANVRALGTVTGASGTPDLETLEILRGHKVVLWPDGDPEGPGHMERIGDKLAGVADEVRVYEWPDPPTGVKGPDAADHPVVRNRDPDGLRELIPELAAAPVRENGAARASGDITPNADGHEGHGRDPAGFNPTDLGNAERFVRAHQDRVLWCPARKSFLVWDGKRYAWDERGEALKLAHLTARSIFNEAAETENTDAQKAITKWALESQNERRINAMLSQSKPYLAVGMEELDRDPWLVNCQNGTLDLKTGRLKDHDPADLITKIVPVEYDPTARCPRFERFMKEVLVEDALITFVKRYSGYTLTGVTRERLLAILYGFGKNGKTTLVELLHEALGDYARNTDVETLLIKKYQGVGNDVAALKGARFVSAAEVEKGRRLAESKVKQLTGSDTVTARFMFGEFFDFKPEFKLWLSTNNKPVIRGTDDAIWDRLRLVPFTQRFEGSRMDEKLPEKLRGELAGVFAWMVEGCLEWQKRGLGEPETVTEATKQYREEMDTLAAFIEERCVLAEDAMAPATPLYKEYQDWCDDAGEKPDTQKAFGTLLRERGFESDKFKRGPHKDLKGWFGIGIRADLPDPDDSHQPSRDAGTKASAGSKDPLGAPTADDRPREENRSFAGNLPGVSGRADDSGPKNQNLGHARPREERVTEKRSASSASSADAASATPANKKGSDDGDDMAALRELLERDEVDSR